MSGFVLSLFPGIGLLDMAFEREGFTVVRGPDVLWGGDIKRFHPPAGKFDGVIGGPPCQRYSPLRHLVEYNGHELAEDLIPEYERCVAEAAPAWFVMENVEEAPEPVVGGYIVHDLVLNNRWVGGVQNRRRRFSFGTRDGRALDVDVALFEEPEWAPAVVANGGARPHGSGGPEGRSAIRARDMGYASAEYVRRASRLQGLPEDFLDKAPFTVKGKCAVLGNGVPLPMGRAIARAVKRVGSVCPACGYLMETDDKYGCPNCEGEPLGEGAA